MDFLDPRKKRTHTIRLAIGYCLVAVAIGLSTIIMVYGAYGYGINTQTGEIIQNGLLFVDSKPGGAQIYLNGKDQKTTSSARLVLPAGSYELALKRTGYRDWVKSFTLDEHSIVRQVYPFLFPVKPSSTSLKSYTSMPSLVTQSPDRRRLLLQLPSDASRTVSFHEYDTGDLTRPPTTLTLPPTLFSSSQSSQLVVVEWASDNTHILMKHNFSGGTEFIIFDRDTPAESVNLNRLFGLSPSSVALRDKKSDQLYLAVGGSLRPANTGSGRVDEPILGQVLAFKPYSDDLIVYVTDKGTPAGKVQARIWDNGQSYPLRDFKAGSTYLLEVAQFQRHYYYAVGSDAEGRVNIYKDPLGAIKNESIARATPLLALNLPAAQRLSFSNNARFIAAQTGQELAVYDAETKDSYHYRVNLPLSAVLVWMDGHRLMGQTAGQVLVMDYDGTNQQTLGPTSEVAGGVFSRDYNHLLVLQARSAGQVELVDIDMRAGADLPNR